MSATDAMMVAAVDGRFTAVMPMIVVYRNETSAGTNQQNQETQQLLHTTLNGKLRPQNITVFVAQFTGQGRKAASHPRWPPEISQ